MSDTTIILYNEHANRYLNHAMNNNKAELVEIEKMKEETTTTTTTTKRRRQNGRQAGRERGQRDLLFFTYKTYFDHPKCETEKVTCHYVNTTKYFAPIYLCTRFIIQFDIDTSNCFNYFVGLRLCH